MCQTIVPSWRRLTLALEQGTLDWAVGNRVWIQQGTLNQLSIHLTYLPSITKKKSEHQRIDAFELWCWRRLFRVPWTVRRSNQSIIKEISSEYSLEGLMLKLKLQYLATWCEEWTHLKRPWCWERLKVGGEGDTEDEMVGWHHWLSGHEFEQTPGDSEGQGSLTCCNPWGRKESDMTEQQWQIWGNARIGIMKAVPENI